MNDFWKEKPEFWKNKLADHEIYQRQKAEVNQDLIQLLNLNNWNSVLDVGGYKGAQGELLPRQFEYKNIDIIEGFDIRKSWKEQGLDKRYDIVMTSLVLITTPPEDLTHVIDEMYAHAKHALYIFEEDRPELEHGTKLNDDYGGKWSVRLTGIIKDRPVFKSVKVIQSRVNPNWVRCTIIKK